MSAAPRRPRGTTSDGAAGRMVIIRALASCEVRESAVLPRRRERGDLLPERFRRDGLHEVSVESCLLGAPLVVFLAPSRQGDEMNRLAPALRAHEARGVIAIRLRHANVEEHQLGLELLRDADRGIAIEGDLHGMSRGLEKEAQAVGGILIVVDNENAPWLDPGS